MLRGETKLVLQILPFFHYTRLKSDTFNLERLEPNFEAMIQPYSIIDCTADIRSTIEKSWELICFSFSKACIQNQCIIGFGSEHNSSNFQKPATMMHTIVRDVIWICFCVFFEFVKWRQLNLIKHGLEQNCQKTRNGSKSYLRMWRCFLKRRPLMEPIILACN